jgi:hypothetical protein
MLAKARDLRRVLRCMIFGCSEMDRCHEDKSDGDP